MTGETGRNIDLSAIGLGREHAWILEQLRVPVWVLDPHGKLVSANAKGAALCGYRPGDIEGLRWEDLVDADLPVRVNGHGQGWNDGEAAHDGVAKSTTGADERAHDERAHDGQAAGFDIEAQLHCRDGGRISAELSGSVLTDTEDRVRGMAVALRDRTGARAQHSRLEAKARQLELLLKETHHRVKNNLQVIASLVAILSSSEDYVPSWVDSLEQRIRAISLIHETIYTSGTYDHVDLAEYISRMVDHTLSTARVGSHVEVKLDIASGKLGITEVMPLGIILSEFLLNSIKHAFEKRGSGVLEIRQREGEDGNVIVEYADDGPGMPIELLPAANPESNGGRGAARNDGKASPADTSGPGTRAVPSVGMEIVHALVAQLRGTLSFGDPPGFSSVLTFPRSGDV